LKTALLSLGLSGQVKQETCILPIQDVVTNSWASCYGICRKCYFNI